MDLRGVTPGPAADHHAATVEGPGIMRMLAGAEHVGAGAGCQTGEFCAQVLIPGVTGTWSLCLTNFGRWRRDQFDIRGRAGNCQIPWLRIFLQPDFTGWCADALKPGFGSPQ